MSRFGIDARAAAEEPAGRGRVVRELLIALAARDDDHVYDLYTRKAWSELLDERFRWRPIPARDPVWHLRTARAANETADAFLSTNSYLTAWFLTVPSVVMVYDLVPFQPGVASRRSAHLIERATIRLGLRRAARIICISQTTRRDLVARFPAADAKAQVVPLAAAARFSRPVGPSELAATRRRHGLDSEFVLCTGTLEPRKNLVRVLRAHEGLSRRVPLALVGPRGWEFEPILDEAGRRDDVHVLGQIPDDDLVALYQACTVFCYPSLYEGFGLPLLEAMASGAACVTSSVSSLPEVGGDAVLYVDPSNVDGICGAIERLLASRQERQALGARASRRAAEFSWNRTAAGILEALIGAAGR
jgi:glycosyltransferase involved in cell wall biosynthesis